MDRLLVLGLFGWAGWSLALFAGAFRSGPVTFGEVTAYALASVVVLAVLAVLLTTAPARIEGEALLIRRPAPLGTLPARRLPLERISAVAVREPPTKDDWLARFPGEWRLTVESEGQAFATFVNDDEEGRGLMERLRALGSGKDLAAATGPARPSAPPSDVHSTPPPA